MRASSLARNRTRTQLAALACLVFFVVLAATNAKLAAGSVPVAEELRLSDLVVVIPTSTHRQSLVNATRALRRGIRTFVATNDSNAANNSSQYAEAYGYYSDDSRESNTWRGRQAGNTRWAFAPFLAHAHYGGSYKWLLLGDDNTLWFMPGVLKLLRAFDHTLPYAITDNLWFHSKHPSPHAPRCLPCHVNHSTIPQAVWSALPPLPLPPACPICSADTVCTESRGGQAPTTTPHAYAPPAPSQVTEAMMVSAGRYRPRHRCSALVVGHGGSGILLSVGLMRHLHHNSTHAFLHTLRGCGGGDCLLSRALIWYARIGFTDPGLALMHGDPSYTRNGVFVDSSGQAASAALLMSAGQQAMQPGGRACNATCRWLVENAVSLHVRVLRVGHISLQALASEMQRAARSYAQARRALALTAAA